MERLRKLDIQNRSSSGNSSTGNSSVFAGESGWEVTTGENGEGAEWPDGAYSHAISPGPRRALRSARIMHRLIPTIVAIGLGGCLASSPGSSGTAPDTAAFLDTL